MSSAPSARIPARINTALGGVLIALHIVALIVLPLIGAGAAWCAAVLFLVAVTSPTLWALIHEAIHGLLLPVRTHNDRLGRALAICFGVPFRAARFAHLRHHRYNRTAQGREEIYDPNTQSTVIAYAVHYARISFGLYLGELALSLLCWMPATWLRPRLQALVPPLEDGARGMAQLAERDILSDAGLWQIRRDAACLIALYAAAFYLYGSHWPLLAVCLGIRALLASQFDHAPHHATPLDRRDYAINMSAPHWLQTLLLCFNFHRTHHQHPNLPWSALRSVSDVEEGDISFAHAVLRQWRGPIALQNARMNSRDADDSQ